MLVWGICRLVSIVRSFSEQMVNVVMIIFHIAAYLFIIVVNAVQLFYYDKSLREDEISGVCLLVIYFVCSLIFGLIVN